MSKLLRGAALAAASSLFLLSLPAHAHVSLASQQAAVGGRYQAVLRVPHGCQGSPTIRLRVRIPEGVIGVKPQPKPGWTLETVKGKYAQPYTLHGAELREGVREVVWSGGRLPDEHYDEFVFVGQLSDRLEAGGTLYFPVVQECEQGVARWIDVPDGEPGAPQRLPAPAPALKLLPR